MSTLKSSAENLTLNADGSGTDIIFQSNGSNVATLDQAGLLTATTFAGSGASLTGITTGKVLQVVQGVKVDTFSHGSASWADITGLTVNITPSSSSNKILVSYTTNLSGSTTGGHTSLVRCLRDSTAIGGGTQVGTNRKSASGLHCNRDTVEMNWISYEYLDSPSTTSATTYKVQLFGEGAATHYINRSGNDGDFAYHGRYASSITVMEIGA